ncbi:MAG: ribonuclease P protein component [Planctomycetota bacterium]
MTAREPGAARRFTFRKRHRLAHAREFQAAFAAKLRKSAGPLTVFLNPTQHAEPRLGLTIGKRVGNAVARNALKRQIREAFRHLQHDLPKPTETTAYDVVVSSRAHEPLDQAEYQRLLAGAVQRAHREHAKRADRNA